MNIPLTIRELQEDLKSKDYSPVELVEAYLARIQQLDKDLNSFITVCGEYALGRAQEVSRIIEDNPRAFEEFPLLGAVVSLKDLYLTKGIRTTAASKVLEDYIPQYSSTVVDRLEKAGAIIVGKTNCDAWAHGASGENSDFGATKNPWNKEYVPGGSSSGSAVSVASRFCSFSMGTDTGGSIRQPASFNNLVGLKPTYGAVPRYGVIAMASSLDCMGHFTRNVTDSRRIFEVIKGEDGKDGTVRNYQLSTVNFQKKKIKIGIPKEYFGEGIDSEVQRIVLDVINEYKKAGVEIKEVTLPHTKYGISVYYIVQPAEVSSNLARYTGVRYGKGRGSFGVEAKRRIMLGSYVLSAGYYDAYYLKAMKVRTRIIEDFEKAWKDVDAIVAPVSPIPPFKIGAKADDPLSMYLADILSVNANLAGIPSISVPAGFTRNGLPVGFQLMGPRFSEDTLFGLGEVFQERTDWHTKVPTL